jgi:hypothetical protein
LPSRPDGIADILPFAVRHAATEQVGGRHHTMPASVIEQVEHEAVRLARSAVDPQAAAGAW